MEIERRAHTGEALDKESWDLDRIAVPVSDIVRRRGLKWDKGNLLLHGEEECAAYYEAGRELLAASGVYCMSTGRVIRLSAAEIDGAAEAQPKSITMGGGKDARVLYSRAPEDRRKPAVFAGNPGCPTPEDVFYATVKSWAQEPEADMLTCGSLAEVDGYPVRLGGASEIIAVRREIAYLDRASADCGRPGMGRLAAQSAVSEAGDLAAHANLASDLTAHTNLAGAGQTQGLGGAGALRPGDSHLVALNNELIITRGNMARAAGALGTGVFNASLACVMVGGLAGGAPGAAVAMIASMLAANVVGLADYHICHPIHLKYSATSTLECMWLQSVVCQAFHLCAPNIVVCDVYPKSGAMTRELFLEVAANALAITASGGHLEGVGSMDGLKPHGTGLEARLMGEVGRFASRAVVRRGDANGIALALHEKYAHVFERGNEGAPFRVAYDVNTVKPTPEWLAMYEEAKKTLAGCGITI